MKPCTFSPRRRNRTRKPLQKISPRRNRTRNPVKIPRKFVIARRRGQSAMLLASNPPGSDCSNTKFSTGYPHVDKVVDNGCAFVNMRLMIYARIGHPSWHIGSMAPVFRGIPRAIVCRYSAGSLSPIQSDIPWHCLPPLHATILPYSAIPISAIPLFH